MPRVIRYSAKRVVLEEQPAPEPTPTPEPTPDPEPEVAITSFAFIADDFYVDEWNTDVFQCYYYPWTAEVSVSDFTISTTWEWCSATIISVEADETGVEWNPWYITFEVEWISEWTETLTITYNWDETITASCNIEITSCEYEFTNSIMYDGDAWTWQLFTDQWDDYVELEMTDWAISSTNLVWIFSDWSFETTIYGEDGDENVRYYLRTAIESEWQEWQDYINKMFEQSEFGEDARTALEELYNDPNAETFEAAKSAIIDWLDWLSADEEEPEE